MVSLNLVIFNQKLQGHSVNVFCVGSFSSSLFARKDDVYRLIVLGGLR